MFPSYGLVIQKIWYQTYNIKLFTNCTLNILFISSQIMIFSYDAKSQFCKENLIGHSRSLNKFSEFDSNILEHLIFQFPKFQAFPFSKLRHPALRCPHLAVFGFGNIWELVSRWVGWRVGMDRGIFTEFPNQLLTLVLLHTRKYPY